MGTVEALSECLRKINSLSEDVVTILGGSQGIIDTIIGGTKCLADFATSERSEAAAHVQQHHGEEKSDKGLWENNIGPRELHVKGFDSEQIWQAIELSNEPILKTIGSKIDLFSKSSARLELTPKESTRLKNGSAKRNRSSTKKSVQMKGNEKSDLELTTQSDSEDIDLPTNDIDEGSSDNSVDFDNSNDKGVAPQKLGKMSIVDDRFFVLEDMNRFLDEEDRKEWKKIENENEEDSDEVDYFAEDQLDDDESESEDNEGDAFDKAIRSTSKAIGRLSPNQKESQSKNARMMMYGDFFNVPTVNGRNDSGRGQKKYADDIGSDSNEEGADNDEEDVSIEKEDVSGEENAEIEKESEDDEDSDIENSGDNVDKKSLQDDVKKTLSRFERESLKMKDKIVALEEENIAQKPWQLVGEATAAKRPKNSLLEEDLSFEQTLVSAPAITEEVTETLEEMIKQRIKDQAWDDVLRKIKPVEKPFEYKKSLTLDQEKSKLSLAEVYEKEFIKKTKEEKEEEVNPEHEVIQKLMDRLFVKLDALSNFQYTPKQPKPELKVVSNLPSVEIEEFTPITVSKESMLAPEEIHDKKKGDAKTQQEKTETDRKRERREKKAKKREIVKKKEQRIQEKKSRGIKVKETKEDAIRKLKKTPGSTKIIKEDEGLKKSLKSSSAFFSQLQETVEQRIDKERTKTKKRKEMKERAEAYKL